ncbi:MAG: DUF1289 domain-containing protein [Gammaproteobacteria bacterium]|nr:DUF1289 domain-containing protein [Gammaproteobacteria bacterium]MBU1647578.1 DUF1289 domain-containing protein [Gammaproteobacteria bacterium]MBU1971467.1 DUF1289 domain-containing protein [Gammaproteobacteria bacterium]
MSDPGGPADVEAIYPCVGICMADDEGAYCLGCGRPLIGTTAPATVPETPAATPEPDDGTTAA